MLKGHFVNLVDVKLFRCDNTNVKEAQNNNKKRFAQCKRDICKRMLCGQTSRCHEF